VIARASTDLSLSFVWDDELASLPDLTWDVESVLPHGGLGVIYGAPASAKTFTTLSLMLAIAAGKPWFGRPVRQGPVVYVYAEGVHGLHERMRALKTEHGIAGRGGMAFLPQPLQLLDFHRSVTPFSDAIAGRLGAPPAVVVIDTLSRNMSGGNENGQDDMSRAVFACDHLRARFGCTAVILHHTVKGADTIRGNSVLEGAVDTAIFVKRSGDNVTLSCTKQRSAAEFEPIRLQFVEAHGSRVLRSAATAELQPKMTLLQRGVLQCLPGPNAPSGCSTSAWRDAAIAQLGAAERSFYEAKKWLTARGYVDSGDDGKTHRLAAKAVELLQLQNNCKPAAIAVGSTTAARGGAL
jgi:hypothetical protein